MLAKYGGIIQTGIISKKKESVDQLVGKFASFSVNFEKADIQNPILSV